MQLLPVKVRVTMLPAFETCYEFTVYLCRQWLIDYTMLCWVLSMICGIFHLCWHPGGIVVMCAA